MSMNPYDIFDSYGGYGYGAYSSGANTATVLLAISAVLAILLAVFFLPRRNQGKFSPVLNKIYHFLNFDVYWLSWIIKVVFLAMSIFLFAIGIYAMFAVNFFVGLGLIASILLVRMVYEMLFVVLSIRDNVASIDRRLAGTNQTPAPAEPAVAHEAPKPKPGCANCGADLRPGALFCANCGARVNE